MDPQSAPGMITLSWLISAQMGSYSRTIRILCAEGGGRELKEGRQGCLISGPFPLSMGD